MKVVHLNASDTGGGAAIACRRLHNAMLEAEIDSTLLVQNKSSLDSRSVSRISRTDDKFISVARSAAARMRLPSYDSSLGLFSYGGVGRRGLNNHATIVEADVIYLHWINNGMISVSGVERILKLRKPVYWVMHDMWPITGGCHHSFDCLGYISDCTSCKFFKNGNIRLPARQLGEKVSRLSSYSNLSFITPSKWLAACTKSSAVAKNRDVFQIPNPVDLKIFKPMPKNYARDVFNLPHEKKIILFGADGATTNPYKGWRYLLDAIANLDLSNINLVIFGASRGDQSGLPNHVNISYVGRLTDEYSISMLYNCADVFVTPSIADNFPNTVVESIACGTPVVGFDVGGIPDLVNPNTGYLAIYRDPIDLRRGIEQILNLENSDDSRLRCAQAVGHLGYPNIAAQHRNIWQSSSRGRVTL